MKKVCVVGDPLATHPGVIVSGGITSTTLGPPGSGIELALITYPISSHTWKKKRHSGPTISSGSHRTTSHGLCIALVGDGTSCGDTIVHSSPSVTTCAS